MSTTSQSFYVVGVADVDKGHVGDTPIASPFYFLPPPSSSSPLRMRRLSARTWKAGPPLCTSPMGLQHPKRISSPSTCRENPNSCPFYLPVSIDWRPILQHRGKGSFFAERRPCEVGPLVGTAEIVGHIVVVDSVCEFPFTITVAFERLKLPLQQFSQSGWRIRGKVGLPD